MPQLANEYLERSSQRSGILIQSGQAAEYNTREPKETIRETHMLGWNEYAKILVAILAVLDPLMAALIFVDLTSNETRRKRARIAFITSFAVAGLLVMSALAGEWVLRIFGISIDAFRVGGGLLLLLMAISMLHGRIGKVKQTPEELTEAEDKETIAVVPLATPLLAGPGSISTMIMYSHHSPDIRHKLILCGIAVFASVVVYAVLRFGNTLGRALGTTGINITVRLLGLLLAAIGVEFIAKGLKGLFPALM